MRKEVGTDLGRSAVVVVNIIGPLFVVIQTVVAVATIACAGGGAGGKMTPDEKISISTNQITDVHLSFLLVEHCAYLLAMPHRIATMTSMSILQSLACFA